MTSKRVLLFVLSALILQSRSEIVDTENGAIEGFVMESWTGQSFHAFLRIPFAEAPIGELRFQPPIAAQPWTGIRNGTYYGPMCWQERRYGRTAEMSEDCLQLNVFTKNLPITELKPVIAFVHGGGFEDSSAIEQGAEYLMDRDIVYVTINYRLGALGFLATGSIEAAGNVGLKDQALALKWIQNNIERFGGDPNRVTIAGLSAGGYSVTALLASPMAAGNFHRVIAMSGAISWKMGFKSNQLETAERLAVRLDCTTETPAALVACLKTVSFRELCALTFLSN